MAHIYNIRDAKIIFRNFAGAPDRFNKNGQAPNFSVVIPEEDVGYFRDDLGFSVKQRVTQDGDVFYHLKVKVGKYASIYIKDEDDVVRQIPNNPADLACLDNMFFAACDISIVPNDYDAGGRTGRSAYLSEMFARKGERSELYREWMTPKDPTLGDD